MEEKLTKISQVSSLTTHLGYWLRCVSNQVSQSFSSKLTAEDVTVAEWVVLRDLFELKTTMPSILADRLGMTRGAISKLVDRLVLKNLISRTFNDQDGRSQIIKLTEKGQKLVPVLALKADENDHLFFGHLDPHERTLIEKIMKEIIKKHGIRKVPIN